MLKIHRDNKLNKGMCNQKKPRTVTFCLDDDKHIRDQAQGSNNLLKYKSSIDVCNEDVPFINGRQEDFHLPIKKRHKTISGKKRITKAKVRRELDRDRISRVFNQMMQGTLANSDRSIKAKKQSKNLELFQSFEPLSPYVQVNARDVNVPRSIFITPDCRNPSNNSQRVRLCTLSSPESGYTGSGGVTGKERNQKGSSFSNVRQLVWPSMHPCKFKYNCGDGSGGKSPTTEEIPKKIQKMSYLQAQGDGVSLKMADKSTQVKFKTKKHRSVTTQTNASDIVRKKPEKVTTVEKSTQTRCYKIISCPRKPYKKISLNKNSEKNKNVKGKNSSEKDVRDQAESAIEKGRIRDPSPTDSSSISSDISSFSISLGSLMSSCSSQSALSVYITMPK